jgi:hypothetical protein
MLVSFDADASTVNVPPLRGTILQMNAYTYLLLARLVLDLGLFVCFTTVVAQIFMHGEKNWGIASLLCCGAPALFYGWAKAGERGNELLMSAWSALYVFAVVVRSSCGPRKTMPDTYRCPRCAAVYARERRRAGGLTGCACGHVFRVPPPDPPAVPCELSHIPPALRARSGAPEGTRIPPASSNQHSSCESDDLDWAGRSVAFGSWAACLCFYVILPVAALLAFMALVRYQRDGSMHGGRKRVESRSLVSDGGPNVSPVFFNRAHARVNPAAALDVERPKEEFGPGVGHQRSITHI